MKFLTDEVNRSYIDLKYSNKLGILQYAYCLFDYGVMAAPASTAIHIAFIIDGVGCYNGMKMKTGDVIAYGINKDAMISRVEKVAVFIISIEFWLFYLITGINPANCQELVHFNNGDLLYDLGQKFFQLPPCKWMIEFENYVESMQNSGKYNFTSQITRVYSAVNLYLTQSNKCFKDIASELKISYRQLQRDFNNVLGITLKEYDSIMRFHKAVRHLEEKNIAQAALESGYWDQSHMIREFKKMYGYTPMHIKKKQAVSLKINYKILSLKEKE